MTESPVDAYLATQPEPQRSTLQTLRERILAVVPDAEECLSYAMPGFRVGGTVVAGIAGFTRHVSYFPHSGKVLPALADRLADYSWATGTLRMPIDGPLPKDLISILIAEKMRQSGVGEQS